MKKQLFIKNAVLLTTTTLITRSVGVWFRVYMTNKIGSQGIGLLSLIVTVYMFAVTLATSGVTLVVTRLVTDFLVQHNNGAVKYIIRRCLWISCVLSVAVGAFMFLNANTIGAVYLDEPKTVLSIKILSVSLPFLAVSACLRGYFFARRAAMKTASEQFLEQALEIAVFVLLIDHMLPMGIEYACCAIVISTTAAEILSFFYSLALYLLDSKKMQGNSRKIDAFYKKALSIGIPVTLSSCLRSGLSMIENVMIPQGLRKYGTDESTALSQYGEVMGMVMPIMCFPNVFLSCFSQLMIPEMSEAKIVNHKNNIKYMAGRIFRFTLLFSLPVSGAFWFFGEQLGLLLYSNQQVGTYIKILAPVIPLLYLDQIVDGMLKGLNEQLHYLAYNIIDSAVRVILTIVLLPVTGIQGVIMIVFISAILNSGLSIARLLKVSEVKIDWINWIIKPLFSLLFSGFLASKISFGAGSSALGLVLQICIFVILYIVCLLVSRGIKKEEVFWVKSLVKK